MKANRFLRLAVIGTLLTVLATPAFVTPGSLAAYAQTYTTPITNSTHFTEDTLVSIDKTIALGTNSSAIQMDGAGKEVTAAPGVVTTVVYQDDESFPDMRGGLNAANGGRIVLGTTKIDTYQIGLKVNGNNSYVELGDDSSVVSRMMSAVSVAGVGAAVKIGDHASLSSSLTDGASGTVTAFYGGSLDIGDGATIVNDGRLPYADSNHIAVSSYGTNASITIGNGSKIKVYANGDAWATAVYALEGGKLVIGGGADISTEGTNAYGVYANHSGSAVEVGENSKISTGGDGAYAVVANRQGAAVSIGKGTTVSTVGTTAHAVYAGGGGRIDLAGATIDVQGERASAIYAAGSDATVKSVISGDGVFDITGRVLAANYSSVDLTMRDSSVFKGYTAFAPTDATLNLAMTGADSVWNMTRDSAVTKLSLGAEAQVDFGGMPLGSALYVGTLEASDAVGGIFNMKTDLVGGSGDLLVADTSSGAHKIAVSNSGSTATDGTETLTVVETGDGRATFKLTNDLAVGAWLYGVRRVETNTNNWELYSTGKSSPAASGAVSTFSGAYLLAYAETQTLMQRLGDLRDTPYLSGFWFRVYGGKFESNSSSFVRGFDMDYGGVQIGYDRKIENGWKGDTYVGGFFGYGKGDLDYNTRYGNTGGNGDIDSKTVGAYATYVQDDGFYADAVVKYMWMKNKFDVLDTDSTHVTGDDVSTGGMGISLELGKRFRFNQNEKGGNWYVEPQVQYSYTHQDGGYFHASNGLRIGVDSFTSSMGRLGVLIGYETAKTNFYAKASYVKEFDGDINIIANNINIPESFGDSWWVYGLGFTSRLNDRNSIYMSVERSDGGKFDEPWKIYGGWRIAF